MNISLNGSIIAEEKAYIHIKDRGFLLGDGVFETLKAHNGHIEFFSDHFVRLSNSARNLFIPLPYNETELKNICVELIRENSLENDTTAMRITLTRGVGLRGINFPQKPNPTLLVATTQYHEPEKDHYIRAMITGVKRNPESIITKNKTLNYLEPILARQEALRNGFDEGIMLNTDDFITECSVAGIFFIKNNEILTPSLDCGVLPGIARAHVIQICKDNGYKVRETKISIEDVQNMDEAFQTNSLIGVQGISQINEKNYSGNMVKNIIMLYRCQLSKLV